MDISLNCLIPQKILSFPKSHENYRYTFYKDSLYFLTCHIAYYMLLNFHINFVASKKSNCNRKI